MEKNIENRASGWVKATLVAGGLLAFASCAEGQSSPPTPEEFNRDKVIIELSDVTTENGEPVQCVMYGKGTKNTNHSKSWFGFDCDFEGTALFPGEVATTTTTG